MEANLRNRMEEGKARFSQNNPKEVREKPIVTAYTSDPSGSILNTTAFKTTAERDAFMAKNGIEFYA